MVKTLEINEKILKKLEFIEKDIKKIHMAFEVFLMGFY